MASREPVDAPEGTAARPSTPLSSTTSASTVGLPRLSSTSRPRIETISCSPMTFPRCSAPSLECDRRLVLGQGVEAPQIAKQLLHPGQRYHVRPVAGCPVRI